MRTPSSKTFLTKALKLDLHSFIHRAFQIVSPHDQFHDGKYIEALAHSLSLCVSGKTNRLLITMPPRYLKSISTTVAFPAFLLGHNPKARIICLSNADIVKPCTRRIVSSSAISVVSSVVSIRLCLMPPLPRNVLQSLMKYTSTAPARSQCPLPPAR